MGLHALGSQSGIFLPNGATAHVQRLVCFIAQQSIECRGSFSGTHHKAMRRMSAGGLAVVLAQIHVLNALMEREGTSDREKDWPFFRVRGEIGIILIRS